MTSIYVSFVRNSYLIHAPTSIIICLEMYKMYKMFLGGLAAPFLKEEEAKGFIRLKRQAGYWDPHHSQNQWGYTVQEQVNVSEMF